DQRVQTPEQRGREAARIGAVAQVHDRGGREQQADQQVEKIDRKDGLRDHPRPPTRAMRASSRRKFQAWITKAVTAVGRPHSAILSGSTSSPSARRMVCISTMAPKATNTSSPKNKPTLSVAALIARTRWRIASSSLRFFSR